MLALVGTSGWQYRDWNGPFYPRGIPSQLAFFSERFATVEVNNSFYRLPSLETVESWRDGSSDDFLIVLKASRYITHIRRLKDCAEPVATLADRVERLGEKRGPVLFQLPPTLPAVPDRLAEFLSLLPKEMPSAFEFRHRSWDRPEIHALLRDAGAALVLADNPGARVNPVTTTSWSYVRFHAGTRSSPFYTRDKLRRWADRIAALEVERVFVFFNNDQRGAALRDAVTLRELLNDRGVDAPVQVDVRRARPVPSG